MNTIGSHFATLRKNMKRDDIFYQESFLDPPLKPNEQPTKKLPLTQSRKFLIKNI